MRNLETRVAANWRRSTPFTDHPWEILSAQRAAAVEAEK